VEAKTSAGIMMLVGSDFAKSSHRNPESIGAAEKMGAIGIQVYIFSDRPTRLSGLENTT
jgi:hypothetical protein